VIPTRIRSSARDLVFMHVGYAVDAVVEESKRIILGRSGNKNTSTAQMMLASTIAGKSSAAVSGSIRVTEFLVEN
jgi:hypothetical protein